MSELACCGQGLFSTHYTNCIYTTLLCSEGNAEVPPWGQSSEFVHTQPIWEAFHHKSKFCAPTTCSALRHLWG